MTKPSEAIVKVVGFSIKIGDRHVTVTPQEALDLLTQLCDYLGIEIENKNIEESELN
jgi:hypothetical protein